MADYSMFPTNMRGDGSRFDKYRDRYANEMTGAEQRSMWAQGEQPVPFSMEQYLLQKAPPPQAAPPIAPQAVDPCANLQGLDKIRCQNNAAADMGGGSMGGGSPLPPGGLLDY